MCLYGVGKLGESGTRIDHLVQLLVLASEYLRQCLAARAPFPEHESLPGRHVKLHGPYAGTILTAVVLLFHKQKKLVEAPQRRTVFFRIIGKGFSQSNERNPTKMPYVVTHRPIGFISCNSESPDSMIHAKSQRSYRKSHSPQPRF